VEISEDKLTFLLIAASFLTSVLMLCRFPGDVALIDKPTTRAISAVAELLVIIHTEMFHVDTVLVVFLCLLDMSTFSFLLFCFLSL